MRSFECVSLVNDNDGVPAAAAAVDDDDACNSSSSAFAADAIDAASFLRDWYIRCIVFLQWISLEHPTVVDAADGVKTYYQIVAFQLWCVVDTDRQKFSILFLAR